jgi:serine/threonine protein kinase
MGEVIGTGAFGTVYVGTMRDTMKKVAIKAMHRKVLGGRQLETFKREVWTMATVNHPSILHLVGVTLTPPFCIVTELLKGNLNDRMKYLTPTRRSVIALHISLGMEELHRCRIIHRDLKSANVLLDEDDMPRVCDFGLVGFRKTGTRTGFVGTTQWMAPELLRSSPFYDEKVDVYSFGVLLWELLTLQRPFDGLTQDQIVLAVIEHSARPSIPAHFGPQGLVSLIQQCWDDDPHERPSFDQISLKLRSPQCHFVGTNEDEFSLSVPKQPPSAELVHAFEMQNWKRFDAILAEVGNVHDDELLTAILSLFSGLDVDRQVLILHGLPKLVDFGEFLCLKGYYFVLGLFRVPALVDPAIDLLRTLEVCALAFRQTKLINILISCKHKSAVAFLTDLCKCRDMALHIAKHNIPLQLDGLDFEAIKLYSAIMSHQEVRPFIAGHREPIILVKRTIRDQPVEACIVLANYPFTHSQTSVVLKANFVPLVAHAADAGIHALAAFHRLLVLLEADDLARYSTEIAEVFAKHPMFTRDAALMEKVGPLLPSGKEPVLLLDL